MSFATQLAADMAFIITRADSEFGVDFDYWLRDSDLSGDPDEEALRGMRFENASDRRDDRDGQSAKREVSLMVPKAVLASVDDEGWLRIGSVFYSIRQVSDADGATWKIKACTDDIHELGDGSRMYGG